MKLKTLYLFGLLFSACIGLASSCNVLDNKAQSAEATRSSFDVARDEANKVYLADLELFRYESALRLERNDSIMSIFKLVLHVEGKSGNSYYKKEILDLEEKNTRMKLQLKNYKGDDEEGWEKFKLNFAQELFHLEESFSAQGVKRKIVN
jgi:hypothetical protein